MLLALIMPIANLMPNRFIVGTNMKNQKPVYYLRYRGSVYALTGVLNNLYGIVLT
jgi:hypothetical protein